MALTVLLVRSHVSRAPPFLPIRPLTPPWLYCCCCCCCFLIARRQSQSEVVHRPIVTHFTKQTKTGIRFRKTEKATSRNKNVKKILMNKNGKPTETKNQREKNRKPTSRNKNGKKMEREFFCYRFFFFFAKKQSKQSINITGVVGVCRGEALGNG